MDPAAQPSTAPQKIKRSLAIRCALSAYPEVRPAKLFERVAVVICVIVILGILVAAGVFAVQLMNAGFAHLIWILLLAPAFPLFLIVLESLSEFSEMTTSQPVGIFDRIEHFVVEVQRRLARCLGITPLIVGVLIVRLCGWLRPMNLVLEGDSVEVATWMPRKVVHGSPWRLHERELSRIDHWVCTRGPRRVYVRTNYARDFCTTPEGFERILDSVGYTRTG